MGQVLRSRTLSKTEGHILGIATVGALATLLPVAAHQLGLLGHLPDPPGRLFDSDGITESKMAHPLGVPDSLLGLGSYGITLALVLTARRHEGAARVLGLKLAADGGAAAFNVVRQVTSFGKLCSWCMGTALCTAVMVGAGRKLVLREARVLR